MNQNILTFFGLILSSAAMASSPFDFQKAVVCNNLGYGDSLFFSFNGNQVYVLGGQGKLKATGNILMTLTKDTAHPGFVGFGGFTGTKNFLKANTLFISTDVMNKHEGTIQMILGTTQVQFEDKACHPFTQEDARKASCYNQINIRGVGVDMQGDQTIKQVNATHYAINLRTKEAGDFTYDVKVKRTGPLCAVQSYRATSCSAQVADETGLRARKDGSSSGEPWVKFISPNHYQAGIRDEESGDFAYDIGVASTRNGSCDVVSMKAIR